MSISGRKKEHIHIAMEQDVRFRKKTSGFENVDFIHCALPEMNYEDVDCTARFLDKVLSFPLMISGITGGWSEGERINRQLAEVCEQENLALGVGSQRQLLENERYLESYRVVRKVHPKGVIVGNVGAAQLISSECLTDIRRMIDIVQADAMAVHLNPLQEMVQPEGEGKFRGILRAIEMLVRSVEIPVIVKEVGCGISEKVAMDLAGAGVTYIDVAGAGGTSWAGIESFRKTKNPLADRFWDWGIPTAVSLEMVRGVGIHIIASGGIDNGVTLAKALALGAECCGAALPFLRALAEGNEGLVRLVKQWREEMKLVMFLTGSRDVEALRREGVIRKVEPGSGGIS